MTRLCDVLTLTRPLVGVDLETTGVDYNKDRVVELALEIMAPGREPKEYRTLINPERPIPPEATAVHGITDAMVADAPPFEHFADNLLKGLTGVDVAGYQLSFDLQMLDAEFTRSKRYWAWPYEGMRVVDAYRLWQHAEGRTLSHAVERWLRRRSEDPEILEELERTDKPHTALFDIKMSTRVAAAQLLQCPQLPRDLDEISKLCVPERRYDLGNRLKYNEFGKLVFNFGKHRGQELTAVPRGYLEFVIRENFSERVKDACRKAL